MLPLSWAAKTELTSVSGNDPVLDSLSAGACPLVFRVEAHRDVTSVRAGVATNAGRAYAEYASWRMSPEMTRLPARYFGGSIASTWSAESPSTIT